MGKSAVPIVASQQTVVYPKAGADGVKQPAYTRSKRTMATSSKLIKYRSCIAKELAGKTGGDRPDVWKRFADAASKCK